MINYDFVLRTVKFLYFYFFYILYIFLYNISWCEGLKYIHKKLDFFLISHSEGYYGLGCFCLYLLKNLFQVNLIKRSPEYVFPLYSLDCHKTIVSIFTSAFLYTC